MTDDKNDDNGQWYLTPMIITMDDIDEMIQEGQINLL